MSKPHLIYSPEPKLEFRFGQKVEYPRDGWTSGYVPRLDTYMGPDTPNPLHISVRRGDANIQTVMADVLSLTKINFNTCLFNDREPVTIRFADAIGDILVSAPVQSEMVEGREGAFPSRNIRGDHYRS